MGRRIDAALHLAWRKRLEQFEAEASSMTVGEFCQREDVSTAAFYRWRKRRMREAAAAKPRTVESRQAELRPAAWPQGRLARFVELTVPSMAVVELELPNGVRVRVPADREAALSVAIRAAGEVAGHADTSGKEQAAC